MTIPNGFLVIAHTWLPQIHKYLSHPRCKGKTHGWFRCCWRWFDNWPWSAGTLKQLQWYDSVLYTLVYRSGQYSLAIWSCRIDSLSTVFVYRIGGYCCYHGNLHRRTLMVIVDAKEVWIGSVPWWYLHLYIHWLASTHTMPEVINTINDHGGDKW